MEEDRTVPPGDKKDMPPEQPPSSIDKAEVEGDFIAHDKHVQADVYYAEHVTIVQPATNAPNDTLLTHTIFPQNLPSRHEFLDREAERAQLHDALRRRPNLVSIDGMGGIGKTSLALEVAYECLPDQGDSARPATPAFEGIIWLSARDRDLALSDALDTIARTLGYRGNANQTPTERRDAIYNFLRARPYLLLVDNFETIADTALIEFVLRCPEPSRVLLTTREQNLPEARAISIKKLNDAQAIILIRKEGERIGLAAIVNATDDLLRELVRASGGAPLAIKWAVGQIKQRGQALPIVLRALREARSTIFDAMFARSWGLLSSDARQVLLVMPLFASAASRAGLSAGSAIDGDRLDVALGQLVEMSLVDATDDLDLEQRRYSIHPLTRAFTEAQLAKAPDLRDAAHERLARFFESFTLKHGGFWQEGYTRIEPELPTIVALIQRYWSQALSKPVANIFNNLIDFMIIRGYWGDLVNMANHALQLALQSGDELNAARVRTRALAWVARHRGDLHEAAQHIEWTLPVFKRYGQELEFFYARRNQGRIAYERRDFDLAEQVLGEALAYFQSVDDKRHIFLTTANLAEVALARDDLDRAWTLCQSVLHAARRYDDPERVASLLKVLGEVALRRDDPLQARNFWSEGLTYMQFADRLDEIADAQLRLARVELTLGESQAARQRLSNALDAYRRLDMPGQIRKVEALLSQP